MVTQEEANIVLKPEGVSNFVDMSSWDINKYRETLKIALDTRCYELLKKCQAGIKLTRDEKDYLFHQGFSGLNEVGIKRAGWFINFRPFLKTYWIKYDHGNIWEVHALDKTSIRNSFYTNSGILKIVEVNN